MKYNVMRQRYGNNPPERIAEGVEVEEAARIILDIEQHRGDHERILREGCVRMPRGWAYRYPDCVYVIRGI